MCSETLFNSLAVYYPNNHYPTTLHFATPTGTNNSTEKAMFLSKSMIYFRPICNYLHCEY